MEEENASESSYLVSKEAKSFHSNALFAI